MLGAFAFSACVAMFSAQESAGTTRGFFMTDGTVNGAVKLADIQGPAAYITPLGNRTVFSAETELKGRELFRSNGTPATTVVAKDIWPGTGSSEPRRYESNPIVDARLEKFVSVGNQRLFGASTPTLGRELWRTDGTLAGTALVRQFMPGVADGLRDVLASTDTFALVVAEDSVRGDSLWASDGTPSGTRFLMTESGENGSQGILATRLGGDKVLFTQDKGNSLWITDGTRGGTRRVRAFAGCAEGATQQRIKDLTGWEEMSFALFSGCTSQTGHELWRTDGTPEGTRLVRNIMIGTGSSKPANFYRYGDNRVYFTATSDQHGREIWRTDGTSETTRLVADIRPGTASSNPKWFARFGNRVVFAAEKDGGGTYHYLYSTNGTSGGTFTIDNVRVMTPFANIGTKLVFGGYPPSLPIGSYELMGTMETAGSSHLIQDIYPGTGGSDPNAITAVRIAQSGLPTPANCPPQ